jgi:hypothetical protein
MVDGVVVEPEESLRTLLAKLRVLHAECQRAYDAAAGDFVTTGLIMSNQKQIEKCIEKLEQKLAKKRIIGEQLWLDRLV